MGAVQRMRELWAKVRRHPKMSALIAVATAVWFVTGLPQDVSDRIEFVQWGASQPVVGGVVGSLSLTSGLVPVLIWIAIPVLVLVAFVWLQSRVQGVLDERQQAEGPMDDSPDPPPSEDPLRSSVADPILPLRRPTFSIRPAGARESGLTMPDVAATADGGSWRLVIHRYDVANHSGEARISLRLAPRALDHYGWAVDGPLLIADARKRIRGTAALSLLQSVEDSEARIWGDELNLEPQESHRYTVLFVMFPLSEADNSEDAFHRALANAELRVVETIADQAINFRVLGGYWTTEPSNLDTSEGQP